MNDPFGEFAQQLSIELHVPLKRWPMLCFKSALSCISIPQNEAKWKALRCAVNGELRSCLKHMNAVTTPSVFCGISAFLKFGFPEMQQKKSLSPPPKLNILYSSHNQCAFPQLFRYSICNFLRREFLLNVSAWDLACRQASLWLTHSSKWESFLPGGTVIPVKWWISFNVPVSNACQSKCQVLTSVITWMFDARFLLFT